MNGIKLKMKLARQSLSTHYTCGFIEVRRKTLVTALSLFAVSIVLLLVSLGLLLVNSILPVSWQDVAHFCGLVGVIHAILLGYMGSSRWNRWLTLAMPARRGNDY